MEQLDRVESLLREHMGRSSEFRETTTIRLDKMQGELTRNTEVTEQVREAAAAAKWVRRIVVWVGAIAAGGVAIWQAVVMFAGRGGGIGPTP